MIDLSLMKITMRAAVAAAVLAASPAIARDFLDVTIELDKASGNFDASFVAAPGTAPQRLGSAKDIQDGVFVHLDLKVALNASNFEEVQKMVDQGFTSEPSGCQPLGWGPLDMEDGLRYFFAIELAGTEETVRATIYPGNRSTHWYNDVFCEYSEAAGDDGAQFRLTGYFFVIHRQLSRNKVDIQLRPVTLKEEEIDMVQRR